MPLIELTRKHGISRPTSTWLWHSRCELGVPLVCLHARHVATALEVQANKTDTNDTYGIAQLTRSGWYMPVAVKSMESHRARSLLAARGKLVSIRTSLYNQIHCFVVLPAGQALIAKRLVRRCRSGSSERSRLSRARRTGRCGPRRILP